MGSNNSRDDTETTTTATTALPVAAEQSSASSSSPPHKRQRQETAVPPSDSTVNYHHCKVPHCERSSSNSSSNNMSSRSDINNQNNNGESDNGATTAENGSTDTPTSEALQTLQQDLEQVEQGLTQQRTILFSTPSVSDRDEQQSGWAVFDSLGSALGNIRNRLHELTGGGVSRTETDHSPAETSATPVSPAATGRQESEVLTALSRRLSTAERAYSTRMPLGLLQNELSSEQRDPDAIATEDSNSPSTIVVPPVPQSMVRDRSVASSLSRGDSASSSRSDTDSEGTQHKRLRSSVLMASRRQAELHERRDMELHEGTASTLFPPSIPEATVEEEIVGEQLDNEDANADHEIELLLPESTREQLLEKAGVMRNSINHYAYHHLTGSLRVLSQTGKGAAMEEETKETKTDMMVDTAVSPVTTTTTAPTAPAYPPLYSWGSLMFQSSSCNSLPEAYKIFESVADETITTTNNNNNSNLVYLSEPKVLPPETRLGRSNIASMSVSPTHMAFATSTGRILICGDNRVGAVDPSQKDKPSIPRPSHFELLAMNRILRVSCGTDHTAAITETKSVLTWGSNQYGQLGHRSQTKINFVLPAALAFGGRAADVACGDGFTLVLTTRMELFLCGREEISGYNALEQHDGDGESQLTRLPEQNSALQGLPLVHIAAGSKHAVVLTAHGTAYSWGSNGSRQCGREFPHQLHVPVPIVVPKTLHKACADSTILTSAALVNWDVWKSGEPVALAGDVSIVHAACGVEHTVLVTKSGRLLVCGSNADGQLGLDVSMETNSPSFCSVQDVPHPHADRKFVSAEAGCHHTLLLDDMGSVWQMGNGTSELQEVSSPIIKSNQIYGIAAGGSLNLAIVHPERDAPITKEVDLPSVPGMNELMEAIRLEHNQLDDQPSVSNNTDTLPSAQELARRIEELFRSPAIMNSLFMDPKEIDDFYGKLIYGGHTHEVQQKMITAMETGMMQGLESMRDARLMYPEAVRFLLLLLQCPLLQHVADREEKEDSMQFDSRGNFIVLLCETILGLPFEGYKALMAWAMTVYGKELFVPLLVQPLVSQLNKRLKEQRTHGVPLIAGVLRWLQNVAEQCDDYLAKDEDFHCAEIAKLPMEILFEDLARFRKSTKADRSVNFYLAANAFLMSPSVKRSLLQIENQLQMVHAAQSGGVTYNPSTREFQFMPYFVLAVDRKYLLQQTLQAVANASPRELRKSLKVVFKGEDGVDAGGVTKEFFQLLVQKLFDVNTGMWRTDSQVEYWFNSDCTWNDDGFYLVGVLVGLALYNSVILDVHFPHAVYRKLLGLPLGLEDMVDSHVRNGLKSLLEYELDDVEDIFCLNFEVSWMVLGQQRKKELKPGGANIPVTSSNKEEYVMLYVKWLLVDSVEPQYAEFERGFMQVMEGSSLDLLRPRELELLVVGSPELDFSALETAAKYEGGFDGDSPVVKNLWRWVKLAPCDTQLKFLKFCTGSGKAPIGGLGELPFLVQRAGPDSMQLPTSHTCFNTLILPDYGDDYDKLDRLLGRAVLECEGFGLQ